MTTEHVNSTGLLISKNASEHLVCSSRGTQTPSTYEFLHHAIVIGRNIADHIAHGAPASDFSPYDAAQDQTSDC